SYARSLSSAYGTAPHRDPPSFPTRRSSDLAQLGPVHVFNPQHIGGVPSTFCWSPVEGCEDPATAIRRADAFAFAVSQQNVDGTRSEEHTSELQSQSNLVCRLLLEKKKKKKA